MKMFKWMTNKILSLFKGVGIYFIFNLLYVCYLVFSELLWNKFDATLFFYFYSPYKDFKIWFPDFYFVAYIFVIVAKVAFMLICLYFFYIIYKLYKCRKTLFTYNKSAKYMDFVAFDGRVVLICLSFYLSLYFLSPSFIEEPLYERFQILIARGFLLHVCCQIIVVVSVNYKRIINYLKNYIFSPQLPYNIAILRILFFSYLALIYLAKYYTMLPTVSLQTQVPLPYTGLLIRFLPINAGLYTISVIVGVICCLFIVVGYKTRWFLILNALCCFYIIATPNFFGKLWHEQLIIWISWFFTFSKCYDVFSLDAKIAGEPIIKSADYTFPVRFVWLQFGIIYFWAGFYKLWDCGFDWALGRSMINQVQLEWLQHYDRIPTVRIDNFPILLYIGGFAVILFELCYPLFILRSSLRWVAATVGILMHNLIGYFMYISFFALLQVFYIFYIDFNKFFVSKEAVAKTSLRYSPMAFFTGIVIVCLNFLCGMFSIDSYPFSGYPRYAALIPDSIKTIYFEVNKPNDRLDVHEVGKRNNFRWESYGWVENGIINDFTAGINVQGRVNDYWEIWQAYNPELIDYDSVRVFVVERPVSPEGIGKEQVIDYICTIPKK